MIQDPRTRSRKGIVEGFMPETEEFLLDGPVSRRIAVIDFDPDTGKLEQGAKFYPPDSKRKTACYRDNKGKDVYRMEGKEVYKPEFMQVSVFSTVLKTINMFEGTRKKRDSVLGRSINWVFDSPQILVVPRAGEMANAYYHRDSNSLQFFYFLSPKDKEKVYTCLSRDIVAHETGHAIIDGIAPDLLDAYTPESLAIHEAVADLTSLLMAFESRNLALMVLRETSGSIDDTTQFSSIGEEFGIELMKNGRYLRNLKNEKNLEKGDENCVKSMDPHVLCEVMSGALYEVMIKIHERLKTKYSADYAQKKDPEFSASGKALAVGAMILRRIIFRALDYLPPGEISFADYGRAMMAVDTISSPKHEETREWIASELVKRRVVEEPESLYVPVRFIYEPLERFNISSLLSSDWPAYRFVHENKDLFHIPDNTSFQVLPRLYAEKKYDRASGRECIFKVTWSHVEPNEIGSGLPEQRRIKVGTTLAIDWDTGGILTKLSNAPPVESNESSFTEPQLRYAREEYKRQFESRNRFLTKLADDELLMREEKCFSPEGLPLLSIIPYSVVDGVLRVRKTGNRLHIIQEEVSIDG